MNKNFKLWAISDAHVGTDIKYGRESLAEADLQSENYPPNLVISKQDHGVPVQWNQNPVS